MTVDDRRARRFDPIVTVGFDYSVTLTFTDAAADPVTPGEAVGSVIVPGGTDIEMTAATLSNAVTFTLAAADTVTLGRGSWSYLISCELEGSTVPVLTGTLKIAAAGDGRPGAINEAFTIVVAGDTNVAVDVVASSGGGGGGGLATTGTITANDFAQFTNSSTVRGRDAAEVRGDLSVYSSAEVDTAIDTDVATHAAVTATHGATGAVVGTTNTQTLTNKTVDSFTNTVEADALHIQVRNESGSTMAKGTPVYISGYSVGQNLALVQPADASSTATMPCIGLLEQELANNASGACDGVGRITGLDTSAWTVGDDLWVSETAGTLTNTQPNGGTVVVQKVATVLRSHASMGVLQVAAQGSEQPVATEALRGIVELATTTEATTGTDTTLAVTPAGLKAATDALNLGTAAQSDTGDFATAAQGSTADSAASSISSHLSDADDAHDASAISVLDTAALYTATNVEAALAEVKQIADAAAGGGISPTGTIAANDIPRFTDGSTVEGLSYSELRAALDLEVGTDVAAQSHVGAGGTAHANAVASGAAGFMTGADKAKLDGIATGAEVNAVDSVNGLTGAVDLSGTYAPKATFPVEFIVALSDMTTQITTGTAKAYFHAPYAFTLTGVKATLATAGSGSTIVDVNEGAGAGTSVLSTKITIEASETTSLDATTQPVISDSAIAADARLTFDIDTAGTSAAGLQVTLLGTRVLA